MFIVVNIDCRSRSTPCRWSASTKRPGRTKRMRCDHRHRPAQCWSIWEWLSNGFAAIRRVTSFSGWIRKFRCTIKVGNSKLVFNHHTNKMRAETGPKTIFIAIQMKWMVCTSCWTDSPGRFASAARISGFCARFCKKQRFLQPLDHRRRPWPSTASKPNISCPKRTLFGSRPEAWDRFLFIVFYFLFFTHTELYIFGICSLDLYNLLTVFSTNCKKNELILSIALKSFLFNCIILEFIYIYFINNITYVPL